MIELKKKSSLKGCEIAPRPPMANKTERSDWTMSTSRNYHDNENWRCVRIRMGGGRSRPDFSPPRHSQLLPSINVVPFLFSFRSRKTQLRRSFLNAVGLNWQKGPRHGATLYPSSAPPPFRPLSPFYTYIYIYNSIKRLVDASRHCWHLVILTSRCETSLIQCEIARQDERAAARTFFSLEQPFCGPSYFGDRLLMDRATVSVHKRGVKAPWN